ncbi:hypothetical protein G6L97_25955 (plasmid) [Agrobacterium tumefaciens]|uniref:hypothetical protein n=1 Tax=Agrobacterium tumefaciens TaxID=358 RepID=UPI001572B7DE|nr:hypothetical protein [Agrobacterium tumefaciens]NSY46596.1 hypothetical protein [Agrobacterium tumefaciens]NSZ87543.1 hypothetical protein [Agrobacterium tumefaciens]WCA72549.1 hypothetical protein G6L97_25955 [Agrobacterium tumefaciens]
MGKLVRLFVLTVTFLVAAQISVAGAATFEMKMFGHHVTILKRDFEQVLTIDGREVLKNEILSIEDIQLISGTPAIVGSSSAGGNAYDSSPFVISFPTNANPKVDGPVDSCRPVKMQVSADKLSFSTTALPNSPGETWVWTPISGFSKPEEQAFVANVSKGWAELREKTITHPGDILEFAEVAAQINRLLGPEKETYSDIIMGVGSGSFSGDYFVGSACTRHLCNEEEALLVASIQEKQVFLAWKPSGKKIVVSPPVKEWPEKAKAALREWAAKWK